MVRRLLTIDAADAAGQTVVAGEITAHLDAGRNGITLTKLTTGTSLSTSVKIGDRNTIAERSGTGMGVATGGPSSNASRMAGVWQFNSYTGFVGFQSVMQFGPPAGGVTQSVLGSNSTTGNRVWGARDLLNSPYAVPDRYYSSVTGGTLDSAPHWYYAEKLADGTTYEYADGMLCTKTDTGAIGYKDTLITLGNNGYYMGPWKAVLGTADANVAIAMWGDGAGTVAERTKIGRYVRRHYGASTPPIPTIVTGLGHSQIYGAKASPAGGANSLMPVLAARLLSAHGVTVEAYNLGVSSSRIATATSRIMADVAGHISPGYVTVNGLLVWLGQNDLIDGIDAAYNAGLTAAQIANGVGDSVYASLVTYVAVALSYGASWVGIITEPPVQYYGTPGVLKEDALDIATLRFNSLIRAGQVVDLHARFVLDVAQMSVMQDPQDHQYRDDDNEHLNNGGYTAAANYIAPLIAEGCR